MPQRRLGAGAFGAVYEAYDRRRDAVVAVKVLERADPEALYRLKRDFRSLADLLHPNLVSPYELICEGGSWMLIMELVEGVDFVEYVRGERERADSGRLRAALAQLIDGLDYLHTRGRLHRDLKPSNVLVDRSGRLRLLDFGLVEELEAAGGTDAAWGAPAYAAPELEATEAGAVATPAADLYSVGVLLFESLTGRRPLAGERRPGATTGRIPPELDELTARLLDPLPERRVGCRDLRAALGLPEPPPTIGPDTPLFGRQSELDQLRDAFAESVAGRGVAVWVHGVSGVGKSCLVHHFLRELRNDPRRPVLLSGRCYRQEAVPFRTFDSLIDGLSHYLLDLPDAEIEALLPRRLDGLLRLFPVLARVPAAAARRSEVAFPDRQQERSQAFRSLRRLLAAIAKQAPLVLFIDDLQWGDGDSAALFVELLRPPPVPLLFIGCYRSEDAPSSALLQELWGRAAPLLLATDQREIRLRGLSASSSLELARFLLPGPGSLAARAERIVEEAGGNPLFVAILARSVAAAPEQALSAAELTLEEVLRREIAALPGAAARFLEVLAVAGRPLELDLARRVARIGAGDDRTLRSLELAQLVQVRPARSGPRVHLFHDRLRDGVLAGLDPRALEAHHRRLAAALEATGRADAGALALHLQDGHDSERAARFAEQGAGAAFEQLAFDRAARLYELALELGSEPGRVAELWARLGDALRHAGRGAEAAEAYLEAVAAGAPEVVELQRQAAEQLLLSGHLDRGLQVLRHVLRTIGIELPRTRLRSLLPFLCRRLAVRRCPLRFLRRSEGQVEGETLRRLDLCWSAALGLTAVDPIRAAEFHARHFLLALRAGEPKRVARALALEAAFAGTAGSQVRSRQLLEMATELAEELDDPHSLARSALAATLVESGGGEWTSSLALAEQAETLLRERSPGSAWELVITHHFLLQALFSLGDVRGMAARLPGLLAEAQGRGDLYAENVLRKWNARSRLLAGDPVGAALELEKAEILWPRRVAEDQPFNALLVEGDIALYRARAAVREELRRRWGEVVSSRVLAIPFLRVRLLDLRGRAALLAASRASGRERRRLLRGVQRDARAISRRGERWASMLAQLLRAGSMQLQDGEVAALGLYAEAAALASSCEMRLHDAAARWRCGELRGGTAGAAELAAAGEDLEACGVADPAAVVGMLAPVRPA